MLLDHKVIETLKLLTKGQDELDLKSFYQSNKLTSVGKSLLKSDELSLLNEESFQLDLLKELLFVKLEEVMTLFKANNISFILLKGLYLIHKFPDYRKFRDINDLDILINKDQLEQALKLLEFTGWKFKFPEVGFKRSLELKINHSVTLMEIATGIELDLHWKLAEAFICSEIITKDYLLSCQQENQDSHLSPKWEFQFIFISIHAFKNNWQQLQTFIDLYLIITNTNIDFKIVTELAKRYQVQGIYQQTLELLDLFFGLKLSQQNLDYNPTSGQELLARLRERSELARGLYYNNNIQKIRFILYRYLLPFGPDLCDSRNIINIFLRKYLRIWKSFRV